MLLQMLADFNGPAKEEILQRFNDDPDAVYAEYGTTPADFAVLRGLTANVRTLLPPSTLMLIDALLILPDPKLQWPGPALYVADIVPATIASAQPPVPSELTIHLDVKQIPGFGPHPHDGRAYDIEVLCIHSDGTEVRGEAIAPLSLPRGDIASVELRCLVTFPKPGSYGGIVSVTASGDNGQPYPERAHFPMSKLTVT